MVRRVTPAGQLHAHWRALAVGSLDDVAGTGTCLILAPHPDDESLGCGGLIAACSAAGRPAVVVILTDGSGSHPNSRLYPRDRLVALRAAEAAAAVGFLGLPAERLILLGEPDGAAPRDGPHFAAVARRLIDCIGSFGCDSILAPWRHDPHCDHVAAACLAAEAARIAGIRHLAYPVWGWTLDADTPVPERASPGWRLDVTPHLAAKQRAIAAHASQHGGLIGDDPAGFTLPAALLSVINGPWETFLLP